MRCVPRHARRGRPVERTPLEGQGRLLLLGALVALAVLLLPAGAAAWQASGGGGTLRPYWHVFAAYAVAWLLVGAWALHIARRLGRLEERTGARERGGS